MWAIVGWVVWALCAALTVVQVVAWYGFMRAGRDSASPLGVQAGFWVTLVVVFLLQPWPKVHLLWCFPLAYLAGLLIPMAIMGLRMRGASSALEQSRNEHPEERRGWEASVMAEEWKCERCGRGMPGVDHVVEGLYRVDPDRIRRTPAEVAANLLGGEYDCPHCGVTYTLFLMPSMGDPSPATALYRLRILTKLDGQA